MATEKHDYIYKTRLWEETRKAVLERDRGICYFCGKLIANRPTVHHLIELTDQNYTNFDIAYNMDNLVSCHQYCHNYHHGRFSKPSIVDQKTLEVDYSKRGA